MTMCVCVKQTLYFEDYNLSNYKHIVRVISEMIQVYCSPITIQRSILVVRGLETHEQRE